MDFFVLKGNLEIETFEKKSLVFNYGVTRFLKKIWVKMKKSLAVFEY